LVIQVRNRWECYSKC